MVMGKKEIRRYRRFCGYDYSRGAALFITIVTNPRRRLFGKIVGAKLQKTPLGLAVERRFAEMAQMPGIRLFNFVATDGVVTSKYRYSPISMISIFTIVQLGPLRTMTLVLPLSLIILLKNMQISLTKSAACFPKNLCSQESLLLVLRISTMLFGMSHSISISLCKYETGDFPSAITSGMTILISP